MTVAGAPNNGKTFFLFGPKRSCYYTITAAGSVSQNPVTTTSECNPLPALDIREPKTINYGGAIWIFGKVQRTKAKVHLPYLEWLRAALFACYAFLSLANQLFHNPNPSQLITYL
jgi:hypothetical protein